MAITADKQLISNHHLLAEGKFGQAGFFSDSQLIANTFIT
jgi:hypothetical protein